MNEPKSLVNKDRTWRTIICINPNHEIVKFPTNEIGIIRCPICESPMVTLVQTVLVQDNELDK